MIAERLTFEGNFCDIAKCREERWGKHCPNGACSQRKVWERLKAYEDTGAVPAVSVPQWISVKDRLPKTGENPVLAGSTEMHYVNMAWYHSGKGVWETPSGFSCSFTHWMPLPKPPKGENDG